LAGLVIQGGIQELSPSDRSLIQVVFFLIVSLLAYSSLSLFKSLYKPGINVVGRFGESWAFLVTVGALVIDAKIGDKPSCGAGESPGTLVGLFPRRQSPAPPKLRDCEGL